MPVFHVFFLNSIFEIFLIYTVTETTQLWTGHMYNVAVSVVKVTHENQMSSRK